MTVTNLEERRTSSSVHTELLLPEKRCTFSSLITLSLQKKRFFIAKCSCLQIGYTQRFFYYQCMHMCITKLTVNWNNRASKEVKSLDKPSFHYTVWPVWVWPDVRRSPGHYHVQFCWSRSLTHRGLWPCPVTGQRTHSTGQPTPNTLSAKIEKSSFINTVQCRK